MKSSEATPGCVGGSRTLSGKPLLANDPHLGFRAPSLWYIARLEAPGLSVTGATLPGLPGVIIGHNARIGWGLTSVEPDVQDLYLEEVDPKDPSRYKFKGEWRTFETRQETIRVRGKTPVTFTARASVHGPIVTDVLSGADGLGSPVAHALDRDRPGRHDGRRFSPSRSSRQLAGVPRGGEPIDGAGPERRLCRRGWPHRLHRDGSHPHPLSRRRAPARLGRGRGRVVGNDPLREAPPGSRPAPRRHRHGQQPRRVAALPLADHPRLARALPGPAHRRPLSPPSRSFRRTTCAPSRRTRSPTRRKTCCRCFSTPPRWTRHRGTPSIACGPGMAPSTPRRFRRPSTPPGTRPSRPCREDELGRKEPGSTRSRFLIRALTTESPWCDDVRTPQKETCADFKAAALSSAVATLHRKLGPDPCRVALGPAPRRALAARRLRPGRLSAPVLQPRGPAGRRRVHRERRRLPPGRFLRHDGRRELPAGPRLRRPLPQPLRSHDRPVRKRVRSPLPRPAPALARGTRIRLRTRRAVRQGTLVLASQSSSLEFQGLAVSSAPSRTRNAKLETLNFRAPQARPGRGRSLGPSLRIFPSRRRTMRRAWAAMSSSCVTRTIVLPREFNSSKSAMISLPVAESRLPGRLVGQEDRRIVDQGAGDRDALALSAGELARLVAHPVGQADGRQGA